MSQPAPARSPHAAAPPVWALLGPRSGDNAQVLALAEALGWPYRAVQLDYTRAARLPARLLGARLIGVRGADPALAPPWPQLVLAAGRRSVPAARWIRRQAGGTVRLVQIGRPRAPLDWFDLVITTPQYHLPDRPNVARQPLPMVRRDGAPVVRRDGAPGASGWRARIAELPRPRAAVLIGGSTRSLDLTPAAIVRTLEAAARQVGPHGSLLVTTSPRTPAGPLPELPHGPARLDYRWDLDAGRDSPLASFLAAADRIVLTGDSVSMLAEAAATRKPVTVVPIPKRGLYRHLAAVRPNLLRAWQRGLRNAPMLTPPSDPDAVFDALIADGRAVWEAGCLHLPARGGSAEPVDPCVVARVTALLRDGAAAEAASGGPA